MRAVSGRYDEISGDSEQIVDRIGELMKEYYRNGGSPNSVLLVNAKENNLSESFETWAGRSHRGGLQIEYVRTALGDVRIVSSDYVPKGCVYLVGAEDFERMKEVAFEAVFHQMARRGVGTPKFFPDRDAEGSN